MKNFCTPLEFDFFRIQLKFAFKIRPLPFCLGFFCSTGTAVRNHGQPYPHVSGTPTIGL